MLHAEESVFRFSIQNDPETLDPQESAISVSSHVINALYMPLMRYQDGKLTGAGAESCLFKTPVKIVCKLSPQYRWSDGALVTAQEVVHSFKVLFAGTSRAIHELLNMKGAADGVRVISATAVEFTLKKPDSEFLYRLVDPATSPRRVGVKLDGTLTTGPYVLAEWKHQKSLTLKPNPYFARTIKNPPDIEALIVDSDDTALRIYQSKRLNFLRRLTAEHIDEFRGTPGFKQYPLLRFDYIGFAPKLAEFKDLLKRMTLGIQKQYEDFQKIFSALSRPGCTGMISEIGVRNKCFEIKPISPYTDEEIKKLPRLNLQYSTQGGDDIRRAMELFHAGWKSLNVDVTLEPTETGILTARLQSADPPAMFRRGVPLFRPTCQAALEIFRSDNPDNHVGFKNKEYDRLTDLSGSPTPLGKEACQKALAILISSHRIIPLGQIHFTTLTDQKFDGFKLNALNQLDVSGLKPAH